MPTLVLMISGELFSGVALFSGLSLFQELLVFISYSLGVSEMGYFKIEKDAAIQAWDREHLNRKKMQSMATTFAAKFVAKPVFKSDISRSYFYAIAFPDGVPTYGDPALWTAATAANKFTATPKRKAPKGLTKEHKELLRLWDEDYPIEQVNREPLWASLGLEWGMLFICGISIFRLGDVIYFSTDAKPSTEFGAIEILGSVYHTARVKVELGGGN
ncbi:hypothetical protein [Serratia fonticola]